jgi:hypothetical protein
MMNFFLKEKIGYLLSPGVFSLAREAGYVGNDEELISDAISDEIVISKVSEEYLELIDRVKLEVRQSALTSIAKSIQFDPSPHLAQNHLVEKSKVAGSFDW